MRVVYLFALLSVAALFSGCKSTKDKDEIVIPADESYRSGLNLLDEGKYKKAAESFSKIYFQHPGSPITAQAELMEAYSLYLASEYDEAADVLGLFIKLHPVHQDVGYAYYLRSLAYYMQISDAAHDQSKTELAKVALQEVIDQFPHTKYAIDASLKLDLVYDHLAGSEMNVGRFYLHQNNPIAGIGRFNTVLKEYQTTSHIQEAMYRMVESYMMLGLKDEAVKYAAVLGYNYPDNIWYKRSLHLIDHTKK